MSSPMVSDATWFQTGERRLGLGHLQEVEVVAWELELEQELELVLLLVWALRLALNLMICEWASMIVAWKVEKVNVSCLKLRHRPGDVVIEQRCGGTLHKTNQHVTMQLIELVRNDAVNSFAFSLSTSFNALLGEAWQMLPTQFLIFSKVESVITTLAFPARRSWNSRAARACALTSSQCR